MIHNFVITGIAAINQQNILGIDGHMPWGRIKSDLAFYKSETIGKTLICGGNTYRSLPPQALKNRKIVVLTRQQPPEDLSDNIMFLNEYLCPGFVMEDIKNFVNSEEIMIVGGGLIYKFFEFQYDKFYLTTIKGQDFDTTSRNVVYFDVDLKSRGSEKNWSKRTIEWTTEENEIGKFDVKIQELS